MKIVLGSTRTAKVESVRAAAIRIARVDAAWQNAQVIPCAVTLNAPAMPLTDEELMRGARERALAARDQLQQTDDASSANVYVGLEGGFHSITLDDQHHTFLRGWAYAIDDDGQRASFGASPSISVPDFVVRRVIDDHTELGIVIDEVANERDVRSRQGAWGVFSNDLLTRAESFELALIAALAPFYNARLYS